MTLRLRATAVLACIGLTALALVGCGGGKDVVATAEPISLERLASAASTSADASSGRFAFSVEMSLPGADDPIALAGEGASDAAADRSAMSLDMSSFAKLLGSLFGAAAAPDAPDFDDPDAWRIDVVQVGEDAYVRFPAMADELPDGTSWVRGDYAGVGALGAGVDDFTQVDPRELLGLLRAASGDVEVVGTEELRGSETTHYRATVDPAEYAKTASDHEQLDALVDELVKQSGIGDVPVDVWLDTTGMVRKVTLAFAATPPGGTGTAESSVSFELWDYGEPVTIEAPPASEVVDASTLKK
jgi:hypothetical protein